LSSIGCVAGEDIAPRTLSLQDHQKIIDLSNAMPLDLPFVTYDHDSPFHRLNAVRFVKELKPTGYHWIAMAYCLAIEHIVYEPPPAYTDGQGHPTST